MLLYSLVDGGVEAFFLTRYSDWIGVRLLNSGSWLGNFCHVNKFASPSRFTTHANPHQNFNSLNQF